MRDKWGYQGWVLTDWMFAARSTTNAVNNVLEMEMPIGIKFSEENMLEAINEGRITEARVSLMASRVFHAMFEGGLFDTLQTGDKEADVTSEEHSLLARELSAAATVLLQNNNGCLPLDDTRVTSIALVGTRAHDEPIIAGGGSGGVQPKYIVTALDGLRSRFPGAMVTYHNTTQLEGAMEAAATADVAIVVVGSEGSEFEDRESLSLDPEEVAMVEAIASVSDNVVVVLNVPVTVLMPFADQVEAIVMPIFPGLEFGNALASVLSGDVNPSGRLPITIPREENQVGFTQDMYPGVRPEFNPGNGPVQECLEENADQCLSQLGEGGFGACLVENDCIQFDETGEISIPAITRCIQPIPILNPNPPCAEEINAPETLSCMLGCQTSDRAFFCVAGCFFENVELAPGFLELFQCMQYEGVCADTREATYLNLQVYYLEELEVGYRWYDANDVSPHFSFGHGLSYTTFDYGEVETALITTTTAVGPSNADVVATISVNVTNSGARAGHDVPQLYLGFPASAGEPPKNLRGFQRVFLEAGETKTVSFTLTGRDVSIFDVVLDDWRVVSGEFTVYVGASVKDVRVVATFDTAPPKSTSDDNDTVSSVVIIGSAVGCAAFVAVVGSASWFMNKKPKEGGDKKGLAEFRGEEINAGKEALLRNEH
jgi:beta-glucosidase